MDNSGNFPIQEKSNDIKIPQIKYRKVSYIESDKVFTGDITPIPTVLFSYLDKCELKVFGLIMRRIRENGTCVMRAEAISKYLAMSRISVTNALMRLKKMGIVNYQTYGKDKNKTINFETIQKLHEILKDRKPGAEVAMRRKMMNTSIERIPESILSYLEKNYTWHDDPDEDEEYD